MYQDNLLKNKNGQIFFFFVFLFFVTSFKRFFHPQIYKISLNIRNFLLKSLHLNKMFLLSEMLSQYICFLELKDACTHYGDDIIGTMASQITSLTIVYSAVYSGADQRKHQSSASLTFVRGIHRGPVISLHKWPVTRKMFPFDDVIMISIPRTPGTSGGRFCSIKHRRVSLHQIY